MEHNPANSLSPLRLRVSGILGGAENVDYELGMAGVSDVLVLTAERFDLLMRNDDTIAERLVLLVTD